MNRYHKYINMWRIWDSCNVLGLFKTCHIRARKPWFVQKFVRDLERNTTLSFAFKMEKPNSGEINDKHKHKLFLDNEKICTIHGREIIHNQCFPIGPLTQSNFLHKIRFEEYLPFRTFLPFVTLFSEAEEERIGPRMELEIIDIEEMQKDGSWIWGIRTGSSDGNQICIF